MSDALDDLAALGNRFHGVDLSFRRGGTDWPGYWRATVVSNKNERDAYRMIGFGHTANDAIEDLIAKVDKVEVL